MHFFKLSFRNKRGETLAARLALPVDEKLIAYALFAHCFTCTKNLNAVLNINQAPSYLPSVIATESQSPPAGGDCHQDHPEGVKAGINPERRRCACCPKALISSS